MRWFAGRAERRRYRAAIDVCAAALVGCQVQKWSSTEMDWRRLSRTSWFGCASTAMFFGPAGLGSGLRLARNYSPHNSPNEAFTAVSGECGSSWPNPTSVVFNYLDSCSCS